MLTEPIVLMYAILILMYRYLLVCGPWVSIVALVRACMCNNQKLTPRCLPLLLSTLFVFLVLLYLLYVYLCCVCAHVHVHTHARVLLCISTLWFVLVLSLILALTIPAQLTSQQAPGILLSIAAVRLWDYRHALCAWLSTWVLDQTWAFIPVSAKPSLQPQMFSF